VLLQTATVLDKRDGTPNVAKEKSGKVPPLINTRIDP
jgi:hypothetical protein